MFGKTLKLVRNTWQKFYLFIFNLKFYSIYFMHTKFGAIINAN